METFKKNAIVGQSGGPTAAINATLSGIIEEALSARELGALYGMKNGLEGLLAGRTVRLDERFRGDPTALRRLMLTPAAVLGSCRVRLPDPLSEKREDLRMYECVRERMEALRAELFLYIGGNDSMDTVAKLNRYARRVGWHGVRFVGVPKTVDNDLTHTDHTPGFGSAAKYVATVTGELLRDCAVYTKPAVTVVELMGRDAGWLTAASALGRLTGTGEPDLVYLPEAPFDPDRFLKDVGRALANHPNVVVAVSEGIRLADGRYVCDRAQTGDRDSFGHRYLGGTGKVLAEAVKRRFGCKTRAVELNLPQRCAGHLLSATDVRESGEVGKTALRAALAGESGVMAVIRRLSDQPYRCEYGTAEIDGIANSVRSVPAAFLNAEGNGVTDACLRFIQPLIEGEVHPEFVGGLPQYFDGGEWDRV